MSRPELVGLLVKTTGIVIIISGLPFLFYSVFVTVSLAYRWGFVATMLISPLLGFLSVAIGWHLLFKGAWIAKKLVQIDDVDDL